MSILIKGQKLPKDGEHYLIQINSDGTVYDAIGRQIACTAVELPPHGRLIDADALKEYCKEAIADSQSDFIRAKDFKLALAVTNAFCKDIDDAPTIIEGDRNDSEKSKTV